MRQFVLHRLSSLTIFTLLMVFVTLVAALIDDKAVNRLTVEGGPIESATVVLYFSVIGCLIGARVGDVRFCFHSAFVVLVLALRELDLHKAFTTESVLKLSYYFRSQASLAEKLVVGTIVVLCLYAVIRYVTNLWRLRVALEHHLAHAYSTVLVLVLIPLSKVIDSTPRILQQSFGVTMPVQIRTNFYMFEETIEMVIPAVMLWAILQYKYRDLHKAD